MHTKTQRVVEVVLSVVVFRFLLLYQDGLGLLSRPLWLTQSGVDPKFAFYSNLTNGHLSFPGESAGWKVWGEC